MGCVKEMCKIKEKKALFCVRKNTRKKKNKPKRQGEDSNMGSLPLE